MKVKICGQTSVEDCEMSVKSGADYLGVVHDVGWSARSLDMEAARPIFEKYGEITFLLTFDKAVDGDFLRTLEILKPFALQLTGREPEETVRELKSKTVAPVFKSVHLAPEGEGEDDVEQIVDTMRKYAAAGADGFVLDTASSGMFGGTGKKNNWETAGRVVALAPKPVFLAGGIDPENVSDAILVPGIYGIDLASGVESSKGVKSGEKLAALFTNMGRKRL